MYNNIVNYTHYVAEQILRTFLYCITETLCLEQLPISSSPPQPQQLFFHSLLHSIYFVLQTKICLLINWLIITGVFCILSPYFFSEQRYNQFICPCKYSYFTLIVKNDLVNLNFIVPWLRDWKVRGFNHFVNFHRWMVSLPFIYSLTKFCLAISMCQTFFWEHRYKQGEHSHFLYVTYNLLRKISKWNGLEKTVNLAVILGFILQREMC